MAAVRYRTIVADPPWEYPEGHIRTAATGRSHNSRRDGARAIQGKHVRRALPYASMSLAQIKGLPVASLAAPNARLWLWTTNRYLPDAFDVLAAWGFKYKQTLVWHKAEAGPFPASVAANTAEFLLIATVGRPKRLATLPSSVIRDGYPKSGGHSAKPERFLDHIESVSPEPRLEMFSRRARFGWATWGDEALHGTEAIPA